MAGASSTSTGSGSRFSSSTATTPRTPSGREGQPSATPSSGLDCWSRSTRAPAPMRRAAWSRPRRPRRARRGRRLGGRQRGRLRLHDVLGRPTGRRARIHWVVAEAVSAANALRHATDDPRGPSATTAGGSTWTGTSLTTRAGRGITSSRPRTGRPVPSGRASTMSTTPTGPLWHPGCRSRRRTRPPCRRAPERMSTSVDEVLRRGSAEEVPQRLDDQRVIVPLGNPRDRHGADDAHIRDPDGEASAVCRVLLEREIVLLRE